MSSLREFAFRHRDKIAVGFFAVVLADLIRGGQTLGLRGASEHGMDALGVVVVALGHGLRFLALRHIGPASRTHVLGAPRLVKDGPYAVVRNPLYVANLLIVVGLCLVAQLRWLLLLGPPAAFALYYLIALAEEQHLRRRFGDEYEPYCRATPRFFPRALLNSRCWQACFNSANAQGVLKTKEYQAVLTSALCVIALELIKNWHHRAGL